MRMLELDGVYCSRAGMAGYWLEVRPHTERSVDVCCEANLGQPRNPAEAGVRRGRDLAVQKKLCLTTSIGFRLNWE